MISSSEALKIILDQQFPIKSKNVPLREAKGMLLAEDIYADRDFPPFHRVTMDGIALKFKSWEAGKRSFLVQGFQAAGEPQKTLESGDHAIEIMTGAVLPIDADLVVKVEELEFDESKGFKSVSVLSSGLVQFKNVHLQGSDNQLGDLLVKKGTKIGGAEIGVLATVGKASVQVNENPDIAIISTGDELIPVNETPEPHQIRKSNVLAIQAELDQRGLNSEVFHLLDDRKQLVNKIEQILARFPVIILSGGVSKGKFDYIPEVLEQLGVEKLFHRIAQRPGKPFWFGRSKNNFVFALPGNPVSTYMCFIVYVSVWLDNIQGQDLQKSAQLDADFEFKPDLTYFLQVKVKNVDGLIKAIPVTGNGSGDLANLANVDGFLQLPGDRSVFKKGEIFPLFQFR